ncbi:MAG TPA: hypothetical protein VKH81_11135 [Candidatus Angelobacter sp.]|nr:hypothetical protein [Candidatus Angelobacter sp.]
MDTLQRAQADLHKPADIGANLRGIKTDPVTRVVPILLMSATFTEEEIPPEVARASAQGYLAHPFTTVGVVDKIKSVLQPK